MYKRTVIMNKYLVEIIESIHFCEKCGDLMEIDTMGILEIGSTYSMLNRTVKVVKLMSIYNHELTFI